MFLPVLVFVGLSLMPPASAPDLQKPSMPVQKAAGAVEWPDPAGDVERQNTSGGKRPGFDLVKLAITSDGTALTIAATLAAPPKGSFASDVVTLYIDTDNNPKTGFPTVWSEQPGFELRSELSLCIEYADGAEACSGAFGSKVKGYYSTINFGRLVDSMNVKDFYKPFKSPKGMVQGPVLTASVPYADLGVKPGQTIRVLARETDGPFDARADFPVVLFTLK